MASMDVFHQDPFTTFQLTGFVERNPYMPSVLGDMDLFEDLPIRTKAVGIEQRQGKLILIQTSPRGAPPSERVTEKRQMRYFEVPRIVQGDTLMADEIQSIRSFGTESELMEVQAEVARRLSGPTGITRNIEYTWENMRLGAIQGLFVDADETVINNWYAEFGIVQAAEIGFDLPQATVAGQEAGALRIKCNQVVRAMARASQGAFLPTTRVMAMCGDSFWDELVTHPDVTKTYFNWAAAAELRKGTAFEAMSFGGIDWFNYRGSDDATTLGIASDKCKFFPKGAPGVFQTAWAPAETFDWVNSLGKKQYVIPVVDRDRNMWWRSEVYSYPLYVCTRPEVLLSGRAEA